MISRIRVDLEEFPAPIVPMFHLLRNGAFAVLQEMIRALLKSAEHCAIVITSAIDRVHIQIPVQLAVGRPMTMTMVIAVLISGVFVVENRTNVCMGLNPHSFDCHHERLVILL